MSTSTTDSHDVTLRNGRKVIIRPICRDDVARTAAFIEALSPQSKHALFLGGITRLSDSALQRLCESRDTCNMAYVATVPTVDGERQVAVCRYAGAGGAEGAEISVAVADEWQHQGLGKELLRRLIEHARDHRIPRLYSIDAASNEAMRRLARDLGFSENPDPDDIHQVIYSFSP